MRKLFAAIVLVLALLTPQAVEAQEDFQIANVDNAVAFSGVYVGAYTGQFLAVTGLPYFDVYCVDFLHAAHLGRTVSMNVSSVDGNLASTRWGQYFDDDIATRIRYRTAAYLASQFATTSYGPDNVYWATLHTAMWRTFTPWAPQWDLPDAVVTPEELIADALVAQETADLSGWVIISDDTIDENGRRGTQEFIAHVPVSTVPEPATVFLLASGLIGVVIVQRRRGGSMGQ